MPWPKRPRDPIERAKVAMDMLIGETPNDRDQVLEHRRNEANPTGCAKSAKARAASQTAGTSARGRPQGGRGPLGEGLTASH